MMTRAATSAQRNGIPSHESYRIGPRTTTRLHRHLLSGSFLGGWDPVQLSWERETRAYKAIYGLSHVLGAFHDAYFDDKKSGHDSESARCVRSKIGSVQSRRINDMSACRGKNVQISSSLAVLKFLFTVIHRISTIILRLRK